MYYCPPIVLDKLLTLCSVRAGLQHLQGEFERQIAIVSQEKQVLRAARQSPDVEQPHTEAAQTVVESSQKNVD
jgi:hypothetical protein